MNNLKREDTYDANYSAQEVAKNGWSIYEVTSYVEGLELDWIPSVSEFNGALEKLEKLGNLGLDTKNGKIQIKKIIQSIKSNIDLQKTVKDSSNERLEGVNDSYKNNIKSPSKVPLPGVNIKPINKNVSYLIKPSCFIETLNTKGSSVYQPRLHFFDLPLSNKRLGGVFLEIGNIESVMSDSSSLLGINPKIGFGVGKYNNETDCLNFNLFDVDMRMLGVFSPEEEKCIDFTLGVTDVESGVLYKTSGITAGSYDILTGEALNLDKINTVKNREIKAKFKKTYGNFKGGLESLLQKKSLSLLSLEPKLIDNTGFIEAMIYSNGYVDTYLKNKVIREYGVNVKTPKMIMDGKESTEKNLMWSMHAITNVVELTHILERVLYSNINGSNNILDYGKGVYFSDTNITDGVNEAIKNLLNSY